MNFSWHAVEEEIKERAAFFHSLLLASADPKATNRDPTQDNERSPGICTAAAVLLKNRGKARSLVPYIISTILKVGRTSKKVNRLNLFFVFYA